MDVDEDITQQSTNSQLPGRTRIIAPVDDAHPFDLEGYISNYSGSCPDFSCLENNTSYRVQVVRLSTGLPI